MRGTENHTGTRQPKPDRTTNFHHVPRKPATEQRWLLMANRYWILSIRTYCNQRRSGKGTLREHGLPGHVIDAKSNVLIPRPQSHSLGSRADNALEERSNATANSRVSFAFGQKSTAHLTLPTQEVEHPSFRLLLLLTLIAIQCWLMAS